PPTPAPPLAHQEVTPPAPAPVKTVPEFVTGELRLLNGEVVLMRLRDTFLQAYHWPAQRGRLLMTTYQLVFLPERRVASVPESYYRIPLAAIDRIQKEIIPQGSTSDLLSSSQLVLATKDFRVLKILFDRTTDPDRVFSALLTYVFPGSVELLFAVQHRPFGPGVARDPGWYAYDAEREFLRQGCCLERPGGAPAPWRPSHTNRDWGLCSSYPRVLVVPSEVTEAALRSVGMFRCAGRIPALTWGRPYDGASIWRSSQPKVGVSGASCPPDEMLLDSIARASATDGILHIFDCRPKTNAMVNRAGGFGFESSQNYTTSRLRFMNIGNIHVMRDSLAKIHQLAMSPAGVEEHQWGQSVEATGWLGHVRQVLSASWQVASSVHRRASPALVHCSHGWDRTSQVCALAQLFLDPYFRTLEGFPVLVCKDWLDFGHPFQLRLAHGSAKSQRADDQMSPIFLQFLDATWQLVNQFPTWFEFNARYLLCIADHLQSCRFGTFIFDTTKEREEQQMPEKTSSLWSYLKINRKTFLNPFFKPCPLYNQNENHLRSDRTDSPSVLLPALSVIMRNVTLWGDYYLRYSPKASQPPVPSELH
ncbi:unnamed protein product, partial [Heterosigma akashiwo]